MLRLYGLLVVGIGSKDLFFIVLLKKRKKSIMCLMRFFFFEIYWEGRGLGVVGVGN